MKDPTTFVCAWCDRRHNKPAVFCSGACETAHDSYGPRARPVDEQEPLIAHGAGPATPRRATSYIKDSK